MADVNPPEAFSRMASPRVAKLQTFLDHEEKEHVVLKSVVHEFGGSISQIPSFLPPKMKEILAELVLVESEIARLEGEISDLQGVAEAPSSNQYRMSRLSKVSSSEQSTILRGHPTPRPESGHLRQASGARAMYFINQAIKGDYPMNGFMKNNKNANSTDQRKNNQERPLSTQKFPPTPYKSKPHEHDSDSSLNMLFSSLSDSSSLEETTQKWHPNKLSESIMKCLICIFTRLIRTTRAMELENSSPISRSFRSENISSPRSGLLLPKDFSQQDPYGIFDVDKSLPRDIGPYKNYVKFTSSSLDAKSISSCVPLLRKLRVLMSKLHDVDLRFLTYQQKLAFWINMYNACIMHGFLQFGLPSSPRDILSLMNKAVLCIGGNKLNALAIERFIRTRSSNMRKVQWKGEKDENEDIICRIYSLKYQEPNVTFALSCGTRSSPAVRIYTADGISNELEKAKLEYLQASIVIKSTKRLVIPRLLVEFGKDTDSVVEWVCHQLPRSGSLRKSMVKCYRGQSNEKIRDVAEIMPYEFDFQYLWAV